VETCRCRRVEARAGAGSPWEEEQGEGLLVVGISSSRCAADAGVDAGVATPEQRLRLSVQPARHLPRREVLRIMILRWSLVVDVTALLPLLAAVGGGR
jgi:hypothetical protein